MPDSDPFDDPAAAHPRARQLMTEDFFWDCVDEEAPFGSDEGHDAYYEFKSWRAENRTDNLLECMSWIMDGKLNDYADGLYADSTIERDLANPSGALLAEHYDMFTLDATVIATALGQLLDEGRIDPEAKPYVRVAIKRQMNPKVVTSQHRKNILLATLRVVDAA
jgi:uncharacterized protein YfeS